KDTGLRWRGCCCSRPRLGRTFGHRCPTSGRLNLARLREVLRREVLRRAGLRPSKALRNGRGSRTGRMSALRAKLCYCKELGPAVDAPSSQGRLALLAELRPEAILPLAAGDISLALPTH